MSNEENLNKSSIEQKIIDLYNSNKSIVEIAKSVHKTPKNVSKILKSNNIQIIDRQIALFLKKVEPAISLYNQGYSVSKLVKELKVGQRQLLKYLRSNGINVINKQNICKFDQNIFDNIDTEEKAYWLGFLFADGSISSSDYNIELSLQEKDKNHLEKYVKFLKHTNKNIIKYHRNKLGNSWRVTVTNKHLWNRLNELGCVPKKSCILKFPNDLNGFEIPFIRGYFDGDGCISYVKNKIHVSPKCSMISTKEFLLEVQRILKNNNIKSVIHKDKRWKNNTFVLELSQKESMLFIKLLYNNSTVYLNRKYNRYLFFTTSCRSLKEFNELLTSEIGEGCNANPEVNQEIAKGS